MKKLVLIVTVVIGMLACNNDPRTKLSQSGNFGEAFDTSNAMVIGDMDVLLNMSSSLGLKATGTVAQYCKGEGCWLTLKNENGENVLVEVKDKAFVLPYNIDGKTAIVNGVASRETTEEGTERIKIVADGIFIQ
jgi:hypothetical protein